MNKRKRDRRTSDRRQVSKGDSSNRKPNIRRLKPTRRRKTNNVVLVQTWLESEQGWGIRPDGASLHLTQDDLEEFVKDYWASMPEETPFEYSRPDGSVPTLRNVDDALYKEVLSSKNGVRIWQHELRELNT